MYIIKKILTARAAFSACRVLFSFVFVDGAAALDGHGPHFLGRHAIMADKQAVEIALLVEAAFAGNFRKIENYVMTIISDILRKNY